MTWLVWIHVLSAFLGIGPTFFGHVLLRKKQQRAQLQQSLALFQLLNYFPKIGGSIAVASGVALVALTGWAFSDLWILISLVLYVIIQFVVVGMLTPILNRLNQALQASDEQANVPDAQAKESALLAKASQLYNTASLLGIALVLMMVIKPM